MSERALWVAVAEAAISDHAKLIDAARKGRRLISIENVSTVVGTLEHEIATARQYFSSAQWVEVVAPFAGLTASVEQIMTAVLQGQPVEKRGRKKAA